MKVLDGNGLSNWLKKNNKTEAEMNKILYDSLSLSAKKSI